MKKILAVLLLCCQPIFAATFTMQPLSAALQEKYIETNMWHKDCPVPLNRLSRLTVSYYDFSGQQQLGNVVVFDGAAANFLAAFKAMYQMHYPLEDFKTVTAFNCRLMRGGNEYSLHAYGLAIDINVAHNPYFGEFSQDAKGNIFGKIIPDISSYPFLNRTVIQPGMNEKIVSLMAKSGFIVWGGQWQDRVDYQHFQVPNNIAKDVAYLDDKSAQQFMQLVEKYPDSAEKMSADSKWENLYKLYPKQYIQALAQYFPLLKNHDEAQVFDLVYQKLSAAH